MSNQTVFLASSVLVLGIPSVPSLRGDDPTPPVHSHEITPSSPKLAQELRRRKTVDQGIRQELSAALGQRGLPWSETALSDPTIKPLVERMRQVDQDNARWLRHVIDEQGWPLISHVGTEGSRAAFLIVQHANADLEFQQLCLALMEAAPVGEVALPDVALLSDRVRLAVGKKQLYGSQVEWRDGKWVLRPTVEPEQLDVRRARMGLPPIAVYFKLLKDVYGRAEAPSSAADASRSR